MFSARKIPGIAHVCQEWGDDVKGDGSLLWPYATLVRGAQDAGAAPASQVDYLTDGAIVVLGKATYNESFTVRTRRVFNIYAARARINGVITFDWRNADRFGSALAPNVGVISQTATRGVAGPQFGNEAVSIAFQNATDDPVNEFGSLALAHMQTKGAIVDANANTNLFFRGNDCQFTGAQTSVVLNLPKAVVLGGLGNSYRQAVVVARIDDEHQSDWRGDITVSQAISGSLNLGMVGCSFFNAKAFSGPAGSLGLDSRSNYSIKQAGWTVPVGAKVIAADSVP